MDPVIEAALIGGGASALVAITAFLTTRAVTRMQLKSARDDRIWDQRVAAYVEAIGAVQFRQMNRAHDYRARPLDAETERRAQAVLSRYIEPDWHILDARLLAFGSAEMVSFMQQGSTAHETARQLFLAWEANNGALDPSYYRDAMNAAESIDDRTIEQIRAEIQGHDQAALTAGPDLMPADI